MRADYRVFIDACVLANHGVCDLLLRLSERPRLIVPQWSEVVLEEVRRTHANKLNWPQHLVDHFQGEIRRSFPEAEVSNFESLIDSLEVDPKDRHVLAAAIRGNCQLVLTFNLRHFPKEKTEVWGVDVAHPQDYLKVLYEMEPKLVIGRLGEIAGRRGIEIEDVLIRLGKSLPAFSSLVLDDLES